MFVLNKYSILGILKLFFEIVSSKLLINKKIRVFRTPRYIRGKKLIDFGENLTTGVGCRLDGFSKKNEKVIRFGNNVQINDYVHIGAIESVTIGNDVLIASNVFITDHNHGRYVGDSPDSPATIPSKRKLYSKPVVIEDNVWIGEFVSILPGVRIGKGSIIGTMSVINKDIPAYSMAVGSPAKVIKKYNFESKVWEKL